MSFSLQNFLQNASSSEIVIASILLFSSIGILYLLFKIVKYVFIIGGIVTALFAFDIINKEKIIEFDKEHNISQQINDYLKKYTPSNNIKIE